MIHYGTPVSTDNYFQESARGGHSGKEAQSVLFWKPRDCRVEKEPTSTHDDEVIAVRKYLENTCRRVWLLEYFDPACAKPGLEPAMYVHNLTFPKIYVMLSYIKKTSLCYLNPTVLLRLSFCP